VRNALQLDLFEYMFDDCVMIAAFAPSAHAANSHQSSIGRDPDLPDTDFDDTDGAYQVAEPDPFAQDHAPVRAVREHQRYGLRAEIRAAPPRPVPVLAQTGQPALSSAPALAVLPALAPVLPGGLRRGSTLAVTSSVSLLLALLAGPSATGAWVAMIGMPLISADSLDETGINLSRLAIISPPEGSWTGTSWTTAVGALLDAVDIVVARPGITRSVTDGAARRLTARARSKDAVLVLFGQQAATWPSVEVQLSARHGRWSGIGTGYGRLTGRQLVVSATGKGRLSRPLSAQLWLPPGAPADNTAVASTAEVNTTVASTVTASTVTASTAASDLLSEAG
jgi:hypothetical protein